MPTARMAMTNLVFPTKPYNKVTVKGKAKYVVYNLKKCKSWRCRNIFTIDETYLYFCRIT